MEFIIILLYYYNNNKRNIIKKTYPLSPYWKIETNKKYILNYNPKIAYEIIKYYYSWKY